MAKITIEINRDFSSNNDGVCADGLGTKITVTELSPENQSGPQDALALIIAGLIPEMLQLAGQKLAEEMTKLGATATCQLVSGSIN